MTVSLLTDSQVEELAKNPQYRRAEGKCPVCLGLSEYKFEGKYNPCVRDTLGRDVHLELFKIYCLANIPLEMQQLDLYAFPDAEVLKRVNNYITNFDRIRMSGMGWEIFGKQRGVGKTWLATGILKELVKHGYSGWFVQFADVRQYHEIDDGTERDRLTRKLRESEILVIDDVLRPYASERQRYFYEDILEAIIRFRTTNNFPTIVTTNMAEKDMNEFFPRVYSLLSAKQFRVELTGDDYRITDAFFDNQELALTGETRPIY